MRTFEAETGPNGKTKAKTHSGTMNDRLKNKLHNRSRSALSSRRETNAGRTPVVGFMRETRKQVRHWLVLVSTVLSVIIRCLWLASVCCFPSSHKYWTAHTGSVGTERSR